MTERQELLIDVVEGSVTLAGIVQSWPEQQIAGRIAADVASVRAVNNQLQVHYDASRPDAEIRADVAARLRWDARLHSDDLEVQVEDGAVRLSGQVERASAKRRAGELAWVSGVRSVDSDGIRVVGRVGGDNPDLVRRGSLDDRDIARAVPDALGYDTRVGARQVGIEVEDGRVTLAGSVPSITARRAAGDLASNTSGVRSVDNRLQVERDLKDLSDQEVAGRIRAGLLASPFTEVYQIDVEVLDGRAILIGNVETGFERDAAERIAGDVLGVTEVDNRLRVE